MSHIRVGDRFGRLTVVARHHYDREGKAQFWECACECGGMKIARAGDLRSGDTQSCGCLHRQRSREANAKPPTLWRVDGILAYGTLPGVRDEVVIDAEDLPRVEGYYWMWDGERVVRDTRDASVAMGRVITDCPQLLEVVHRDKNAFNLRKSNLLLVNDSYKMAYSRPISLINGRPPTSRYKGVSRRGDTGKWVAQTTINYKNINIGSFPSEAQAAKAYDTFVLEKRGGNVLTNAKLIALGILEPTEDW